MVDVGVWMTLGVWSHKIAWEERVDCLQEPLCSVACVRVEEQEEEPPEKDRRIRRVARGQEPGERGVNVAEQWSQRRPEARGPRSAGMGAAR